MKNQIKKILMLVTLMLGLGACTEPLKEDDHIPTESLYDVLNEDMEKYSQQYDIIKVTFEGHDYIVIEGLKKYGITHSGKCEAPHNCENF